MDNIMIDQIKIESVFSEEVGKYVVDFHYRFEKELNMSTDHDTGEPSECYGKITTHYSNPIRPEKLAKWHMHKAPLVLQDFTEEELSYIVPISKEEYQLETGEKD